MFLYIKKMNRVIVKACGQSTWGEYVPRRRGVSHWCCRASHELLPASVPCCLRDQPQARWLAMLDRAVHIVCALVCVVILGVFLYNYEKGVL